MSALLKADLVWCECLLDKFDASEGRMPADCGVGGRGGRGDFSSGSGREVVLSLTSTASRSRFFKGRFAAGEVTVEPEEEVGREGGRFDFRCGSAALSSGEPLGSGALVTRPVSLVVRLGLSAPVAETVCALDIFGWFAVSATMVLSIGCGLRACATAIGPTALARPGTATLAMTKLASMVTGSAFSLILSSLAASPSPNTMCCTLLYSLRQVLKASDCGFEERS